MAGINLSEGQIEAIRQMKNGCILKGSVGSGKSRTALAYYYLLNDGKIGTDSYEFMINPCDLYIITTAKKRDSRDWEKEMNLFLLSDTENNYYKNTVVVDSWNNIHKYINIKNAFFIFDEQRACGTGMWAKCFIKIAKKNRWVMLSATPGDDWKDYAAVFTANGFYYCISDFKREHFTYVKMGSKYIPNGYMNVGRLIKLKKSIVIPMKKMTTAVRHDEYIYCDYEVKDYRFIAKNHYDIYKQEPIKNASGVCYVLRKVSNADARRIEECTKLVLNRKKVIIFYNFDYELEMLRQMCQVIDIPFAEWNGHKHQDIPVGDEWVYLVNYMGGAEGWECISTDTMIFYSQTYSYKAFEQAHGRIDRMNTRFTDLYYYSLMSKSPIDIAIRECLRQKKDFNESDFIK